ncbi:MAG: ORF6N domain-containing protein [Elusimicrobia bacterium]|nr:ORF6N domain-containing protein [Elusimicrobiota bacterium]
MLSQRIENKIYFIRGQKVMIDRDLAELYGVATRVLNQAVRRNSERFPKDFMFELTWVEAKSLRSQIVTLNNDNKVSSKRGKHIKYLPYVFAEQGVAMLSSVLNSKRAIHVNIQIMRTFTKLRALLSTHKDLQRKIEEMEKKYDQQFRVVFDAIKSLLTPLEPKRKKIGFL